MKTNIIEHFANAMKTTAPSRMSSLRYLSLIGLLITGFLQFACSPPPENYNIPAEALRAQTRTSLDVGDVIRISYPGAPEYNQVQKIRPDGKVSLPMVGNVSVSGRSVSSVQQTLRGLYESHLNDPTVVVAVEQASAAVYVSGEVNKPGKVQLDRKMTALEAIMESGGFTRFANPKQVFVIRNEGGQQQRYPLNLSATLSGHTSQAFYLRPYDVIYVKQSNW